MSSGLNFKAGNAMQEFIIELETYTQCYGLDKDRIMRMWDEMLNGYESDPTLLLTEALLLKPAPYDALIIIKDIAFTSVCRHHLLPFFGVCYVGYLPDKAIVGLSKIPRVVECFARRLQLQEQLTVQIGDTINKVLLPLGLGVIIKAKHLCMMARGIERREAEVVTSFLSGIFKESQITREEFLRCCGMM